MRRTRLYRCLLPLLGLAVAGPTWAQSAPPRTRDDFGGIGLLQMPTARMAPVGEFSFHADRARPYSRYAITVQPFSWLQGTFLYTAIANRLYGPVSFGGGQSYKDKAVNVKLRLHKESRWWPAIAVGARDLGGTGLFSGEFVVATKRFGPVGVTLGLGWGYTGARGNLSNPFGWIDNRFNTRPAPNGSVHHAGKPNFKHYFRGPTALFGGIEYQTPWAPLSLKLEYDGNNYQHEPKHNKLEQDSPFNFGVVYRVNDNINLTLGYERGNTALFGFTIHGNIGRAPPAPKPLDPPPEPVPTKSSETPPRTSSGAASGTHSKTPAGKADWADISQRLRHNAGFEVSRISRRGDELYLSGQQWRYFYPSKAVGRASRILDNAVGPGIDWFTFVRNEEGLPAVQTSVHRQTFDKFLKHEVSLADLRRNVQRDPPNTTSTRKVLYRAPFKRYHGGFGLGLTENIGGPDAFVLYRLNATYNGEYRFTRHLWLSTTAQLDLIDNYDKFTYTAPSRLPRVRTYVRQYLTTSRINLANLQLTWARKLSPDWYGMVYGGLLESMYGGVGGQVLYRPFDTSWAVAANVNWVRQRGFKQHFGFRDYHITTGHVTGYFKTHLDHILATVAAGRYLAGDWGGTLGLSRVFNNGVRMGVWATFTTADGKKFGEGSFDKGFYITIPFSLMLPRSTTLVTNFTWDPLIRDGGAMLARHYDLYALTSARDPQLFNQNFKMISQ